jgi:hypothetical protein
VVERTRATRGRDVEAGEVPARRTAVANSRHEGGSVPI